MKKFIKYGLISFALNLLAIILIFLIAFYLGDEPYEGLGYLVIGLLIFLVAVIVQLIIAGRLLSNPSKKDIGEGMLLGVAVMVLIGTSICGGGFLLG